MPLFELDDGRPRLVQPMQPLPASFSQDLALLVQHHLAAIAGEPLFPVRHRASASDHADLPELLALDSTGRAVVLEAVQVLDDDAVVAALRHAGAASRMTSTDLARAYHADPERFAVDFAAFREQVAFGMTSSRREGVRLLVVCSEVAPEAADTLGYLRGPGRHVDILQLGVVRGVDDRRFLDVSPLARHENVRRPVEPTALRLVRSSEASFATAMAYEDGRRRPPSPVGSSRAGMPGLPASSAFPAGGRTGQDGPGRPVSAAVPAVPPPPRPTSAAGTTNTGMTSTGPTSTGATSTGPTTASPTTASPTTAGPTSTMRAGTTTAGITSGTTTAAPGTTRASRGGARDARPASETISSTALPVAGTPSRQVGAQTRAVPTVVPPVGASSGPRSSPSTHGPAAPRAAAPASFAPRAYSPPANRTTSPYVPPANHAPTSDVPANPALAKPAASYGAVVGTGAMPSIPVTPRTPSGSRATSTAPTPSTADARTPDGRSADGRTDDGAHDRADDRAHDRAHDRADGLSPLFEALADGSADLPDGPPRPSAAGPAPRDPDVPYPELAMLAKRRRAIATLVWLRERRGQRLVAELQPDGTILLPDGARFVEPGDAAAYASSSSVEVDGWRAWRLGDGGPTLAEATGRTES